MAAALASMLDRTLVLLNAMPASPPLMSLASVRHAPMDYSERADAARDRARSLLAELARHADAPSIELEIGSGLPAESILDYATRTAASFIVMGTHNRGLLASAVLGSVSSSVVAATDRPVLLVPSDHRPTVTSAAPIVVGLDETPLAVATLHAAADLADRAGMPLIAAHVVQPPAPVAPGIAGGLPVPAAQGTTEEDRARVERLRELSEGVGAEFLSRRGGVADELVAVADERGAAMLGLGTQAFGRVRAALLGSVSRAVLDHATVPLMVVTESAVDGIGAYGRRRSAADARRA